MILDIDFILQCIVHNQGIIIETKLSTPISWIWDFNLPPCTDSKYIFGHLFHTEHE